MKQVDIEYLDGEFVVQESEPSTVAEVVQVVGTEEAVVDDAVSNLRYRNKYPRVYKAVSAAIESSFPRAVVDKKKNKDGSERDIKESEMDHLRAFLKGRADAEGNIVEAAPVENRTTLDGLFKSIAPEALLFVQGERVGGGKVSAAALEAANKFFAAGADKVDTTASRIEELVPGYRVARDTDGAVTIDGLARGIQALDRKLANDAKQQRMAALS